MASKRISPTASLSTSQTLQHVAALGIGAIAVAVRAYVSWRTHVTADSALIIVRYADNIAAGRGFVSTPGEHILGISCPLYALLLSIFSSVHLNTLLCGKACNIAAEGVTCYLLARLFTRKEIARPVEGLFAASLYASSSTPITVNISGIETGLINCIGLAMVYAYVARRPFWLFTLGGVLLLLSIEGLLLFGVLAAALALRERNFPSRAGAVALIITIPWLIFATLYFGSPVPTALPATSIVNPPAAQLGRSIKQANLGALAEQFASGPAKCAVSLLFALGAILVVGQAVLRIGRGVMIAPLLWFIIYVGAMVFSQASALPWKFAPLYPMYFAIACLAGATAPIKLGKMRPDLAVKWSGRAVPAALAVLILLGMVHIRSILFENEVSRQSAAFVAPASNRPPQREPVRN